MLSQGTKTPTYGGWLFWLQARNRSNNNTEKIGFWTGPQDQAFTIGAENRTYNAASIIEVEPFSYSAGADNIQSQTLRLNGVSPALEVAVRQYEARQAKIEIHQVEYPAGLMLATPSVQRVFKGRVDEISFERKAADEKTGVTILTCEISLMSSDRMGTRKLYLRKSAATQKRIDPNDAGRDYAKSKAKVTWMGETKDPYRYTPTQQSRGIWGHVVEVAKNAAEGGQ